MCNQFILQTNTTKIRPRAVTPPTSTSLPQKQARDSEKDVVLRQVLADMKRHRLSGESSKVAETWNSLGLIRLHMQRDASSARECHEEALRIVRNLGDKKLIAITLHDLGYCLERMQEREQALTKYEEAISHLKQACVNKSHPRMIATQRAMDRVLRS